MAAAILVPCLAVACGRTTRDSSAAAGTGGVLVTGAAGGSGAPLASAGDAGSAGTSTAELPPPTGGVLHDEGAGRLIMRRITNREYSNIMADLIGDGSKPGAALPVDGPSETGFEAPSGVEELNVDLYNQTADRLAESALAAGKLGLPDACQAPAPTDEESCAKQFIAAFGGRAYRRPITADESADLLVLFHIARDPVPTGAAMSFPESIAQTAKGMLQSPNFLYHWEIGPTKPVLDPTTHLVALTPHQVASRLAEMLWESMPDATLLGAADAGELATPEQVQAQALRMLGDPHAANALFNFHQQWLLAQDGQPTELSEISKISTAFTPGVAQSLAGEFTGFLSSVYGPSGDGTLKTLLTAPYTYANQDIATLYGNTTVTSSDFARIDLDPSQRSGILTQTAFLASHAETDQDNPSARGLAVLAKLLCSSDAALAMPMQHGVSGLPPLDPNQTTRQRWEAATQLACATGCHKGFDPAGFAFENYDAIGAYRTLEAGQNVDASGSFTTPGGATIRFQSAIDLSSSLAQSEEVKWCVNRQWLRYTLGRMESDAEQGSLERAYQKAGETAGYSLRDMVLSIVGSVAFRFRAPSDGEAL
jgi:hypothetical protein